jgi:hypothetical protein
VIVHVHAETPSAITLKSASTIAEMRSLLMAYAGDSELRRHERLDKHRSFAIPGETRSPLDDHVAAIADVRDPDRTANALNAATVGPFNVKGAIHRERHHLHCGGTSCVGPMYAKGLRKEANQILEKGGGGEVHVGLLASVSATL